jgi:hypothetical protein
MASIINATTTNGLSTSADNSGSLQLATNNGTTALTIDTSQNVGIGTTSPSRKLQVHEATAATNAYFQLSNAATGSGATDGFQAIVGTGGEVILAQRENAQMEFWTNNTERMRIDSSGNLLVGTTSSSATTAGVKLINYGSNFFDINLGDAASSNASTRLTVYSTGASAYRFYVGMGGSIYATNTTITGISDVRLKENIKDLDDGLSAVIALKPRKFDWKSGKGKDIKGDRGFIAQEFETIFPDMIDEWKDPAPEGEEPYKSVRADLIPVLVKAIQELNAKVEAQAVRIAELEGAK